MKKLIAFPLVTILFGCVVSAQNLMTQPDVNLNQYAGIWYEQARLPNQFQKDCVGDVQADYKLNPDGTIQVINQCRDGEGGIKVNEGKGRLSVVANPQDPAKLEIRFAPKWLSWLPMVWGDYWILKLQGDYEYSLVGTPDREYLWVLSRDKQADKEVVNELLDYAKTLGFSVDQVVTTLE